ncbi:hypothetical protein H0I29_00985 [Polaribacter sp. R2A056_3_33]|uniref:hypothetical protein n=1 Tax=Polaribacter sp. R2A056_3_33 TaxID=2745563 RepID=UPI001C50083A|nr:hypothetical protein [Polaribacter sp. R2A056_3_33]QXP70705.1 hypothetical protein H0I29_00985 [Polaribacter sp. R2A056_3_33]
MIKYELKREKKSDGWMVMIGYDFITVKPSELQKHLDDGWTIIRKKYFIITSFLDWWATLKNGEKIAFFGVALTPFLIPLMFPNETIINVYPSNESDYYKVDSDSQLYDSDDSTTIKKEGYKQESLTREQDSVKTNDSIPTLKN